MKRKKVEQEENANVDSVSDINGAVNYLKTMCKKEGKVQIRGNVTIKTAVDIIEKTSSEIGVSPHHINSLIDVVGCSKLTKGTNHRLIKSLIPATVVPQMAIVKTVSWMSTSSVPSNTKALFLHWILVIFNQIDDKEILHGLYSFLFLFIDNATMQPHLCHLLYLLTRKEDVRHFRIRTLLQINQTSVQQSHVLGLLSVYKLYCPHLVVISVARSRKVFFRQVDRVWLAKVRKVISANGPTSCLSDNPADLLPKPTDFYVQPQTKKKRLDKLPIPNLRNAQAAAVGSGKRGGCDLVPFSQITSFELLLKNLDRFELPSQIGAVLMDRNVQHVLACLPDPVMPLRVSYWLNHMLYEEFMNTYTSNEIRQGQLLRMMVELSEFLQEGLPICDNFLSMYLRIWNGMAHRTYIFKLITRCRLYQFSELNEMILEPLRQLFFCSSVYFKCETIICFTELLQNFSQVEYRRHDYTLNLQMQRASSTKYLPDVFSVFTQEIDKFSASETIQKFIQFVDAICVVSLQQENSNLMLMHCILGFFEQVAGLYNTYDVPLFCVPSYGIWYSCLFHPSAVIVARLCALVCKYREAYTALRKSNMHLPHQSITIINTYMTDMCDMLWRNRAFIADTSTKSIFRLVTTDVREKLNVSQLPIRCSINLHRALLCFSFKFHKSHPNSSNQVPNFAIKRRKDVYLEFLAQEHLDGISEFVKTCIRSKKPNGSAANGSAVYNFQSSQTDQ